MLVGKILKVVNVEKVVKQGSREVGSIKYDVGSRKK